MTITKEICRKCGCTNNNPCYHPKYGFCWWKDSKHTICSHCAKKEIKNSKHTQHRVNDIPDWLSPEETEACFSDMKLDEIKALIKEGCGFEGKIIPKEKEKNDLCYTADEIAFEHKQGERMTTGEFADKVSAMREAQKEYFKYRTNEALQRSKQLEKEVDSILETRRKRSENTVQQGTLF